ncbi:hypothetical protein CCP4SC76_2280024 [Gammaproteobacteria bacterium]
MKPRPDHESALRLGVDVRKKLAKKWPKSDQNGGLWEGGALRLKTGNRASHAVWRGYKKGLGKLGLLLMEPARGIEPPTFDLQGRCSTD